MNDTAIMRVEWETVTGVLGPNLRGIFPPATDVTDVNSSCRSKDQRILATGDDFGHVKLFNYPVTVSFLINISGLIFIRECCKLLVEREHNKFSYILVFNLVDEWREIPTI